MKNSRVICYYVQVEVFWVVTLCSQPKRPRLESSLSCKPNIWHQLLGYIMALHYLLKLCGSE
jgi:hypothetical protein